MGNKCCRMNWTSSKEWITIIWFDRIKSCTGAAMPMWWETSAIWGRSWTGRSSRTITCGTRRWRGTSGRSTGWAPYLTSAEWYSCKPPSAYNFFTTTTSQTETSRWTTSCAWPVNRKGQTSRLQISQLPAAPKMTSRISRRGLPGFEALSSSSPLRTATAAKPPTSGRWVSVSILSTPSSSPSWASRNWK